MSKRTDPTDSTETPTDDLPGMWEHADLSGGETDQTDTVKLPDGWTFTHDGAAIYQSTTTPLPDADYALSTSIEPVGKDGNVELVREGWDRDYMVVVPLDVLREYVRRADEKLKAEGKQANG